MTEHASEHDADTGTRRRQCPWCHSRDVELVRAMGFNGVRKHQKIESPGYLYWADALGLLVWEEIPWCRGGLGGERYKKQARDMLRAMIDQHRNHPSVILWGLQNESEIDGGGAPVYRAWLQDMKDAVKAVDLQNRPVTWASSCRWKKCRWCRSVPSRWQGRTPNRSSWPPRCWNR